MTLRVIFYFLFLSACGGFDITISDTLKTQDTLKNRQKLPKSPGKAMLLSTVFPGGGQFYTQNYIKGVLIGGAETVLGYLSIKEHTTAQRFLKDYDTSNYIYHRNKRNDFLFLTGAVLAFSLADAYVSAHMFRFREEERLSSVSLRGMRNAEYGMRIYLSIAFHF